MKISIRGAGKYGVLSDPTPEQIPLEAWSALQNVRIRNGRAGTVEGYTAFTTPTVAPYYLLPYPQTADFYWFYAGLAKIYQFNGSTHTDVTRQTGGMDVDYTGSAEDRWSGTIFGGIPILNNGVDNPQYFDDNATKFKDLLWDGTDTWATAGVTTKVMAPFGFFLIGLYVTEAGTPNPHKLIWSNPAEPEAIPDSWDYTSATNTAGFVNLAETPGYLVDGLTLRNVFVIYKEDSAYGMQYIAGNDVFSFYRLGDMPGMLAQGCAVQILNTHVVLARNDLYRHDGNSWNSIVSQRVKNALFNDIDPNYYYTCYLAKNDTAKEVWVCYPTLGSTLPDKALVWNYEENTFSFRALPAGTAHIARGVLISSAVTWDTLPYASWEEWTGTWGGRTYSGAENTLVGASDVLYSFGSGNQAAGTALEVYLERTGLRLGEPGNVNTLLRLYPQMSGGGPVDFYVGSQQVAEGAVAWQGPYSFTPGTDRKLDCRVTGEYHAIRLYSMADVSWELSGIDLDFNPSGKR